MQRAMASTSNASLLDLPNEIKLQIWEYAFGNLDVPIYTGDNSDRPYKFNEFTECEACRKCSPSHVANDHDTLGAGSVHALRDGTIAYSAPRPEQRYYECLRPLLASKQIFEESVKLFQSTLTLHVKSPEAIAHIRHSAPASLRERITKLVLYIHFNHENHFLWCMRLFELHEALPALKHIDVEYHMRPPVSYDNLLDVVHFYIPLLELKQPFSPPLFVVKAAKRATVSSWQMSGQEDSIIPAIDPKPGLTIYTAYQREEHLFEAHFLGQITTADAIDEHTSVVSDLFHDPAFVAAAHHVVQMNHVVIDSSVIASHPPGRYPPSTLQQGFPHKDHLPVLHQALLLIARRHERPWFEKLQKRRIVEIFIEQGAMNRQEAETLLERQLAALPPGQGIEDFLERLMTTGGDVEDLVELFGVAAEG